MHIVDLSLPINRHMAGIPARREFLDNPTRCVVFSSLSSRQLEQLKEQGLQPPSGSDDPKCRNEASAPSGRRSVSRRNPHA
jgi:hypothetical protein